MGLERGFRESEQVFQKRVDITGDKVLAVQEQIVVIGTTTADLDVTLPPVHKAVGKIYTVHAPTIGTDTNACTLQDGDESVDWNGDYTLDADNDRISLISDGRCWWEIDNQIA